MPLGIITSKAEIRSEATKSRRSPRSKISRTLPLLSFLIPGRVSSSKGSLAMPGEYEQGAEERNGKTRTRRFSGRVWALAPVVSPGATRRHSRLPVGATYKRRLALDCVGLY